MLLIAYVIFMIAGDLSAYLIGLIVEREFGSQASLIVFLALYFLFLWFSWLLVVWMTEPKPAAPAGKRLFNERGISHWAPASAGLSCLDHMRRIEANCPLRMHLGRPHTQDIGVTLAGFHKLNDLFGNCFIGEVGSAWCRTAARDISNATPMRRRVSGSRQAPGGDLSGDDRESIEPYDFGLRSNHRSDDQYDRLHPRASRWRRYRCFHRSGERWLQRTGTKQWPVHASANALCIEACGKMAAS